jgi:hypothetical protein
MKVRSFTYMTIVIENRADWFGLPICQASVWEVQVWG